MRAALYARYSSDLQNDRSAADQLAALRAECGRRGWTVAAEFADEGVSGAALAGRPGVRALLAACAAAPRPFDVVFVEAQDRLSRGQADAARIFELLTFHGVAIEKLNGGTVTALTNTFDGLVAAQFLADLAFKTRRGLVARVRAGSSGGGRCYGYDLGAAKGELVVNPAQAAVVRRVFRAYAEGRSPRAIAHALNADGVPGPRGGTWAASAINGDRRSGDGLLWNRLYAGERVFNRHRWRKHPETGRRSSVRNPPSEWVIEAAPDLRIVPEALWRRVQARRDALGDTPAGRARRPKRLLSGLVRCGVCGGSMTLKGGKFVCSTRAERGPAVCSNGKCVDARALEARVLAGLRDKVLAPEAVEAAVRRFHEALNAERADRRRAGEVEAELAEVGRRLDRAADAYERGAFEVEELAARVAPLKARRDALRAELAGLEGPTPVLRVHPGAAALYRQLAALLPEHLEAEDATAARDAIRAFLDRIDFHPHEAHGAYGLTVQTKMAALVSQDGHKVGGNGGCGDRIWSIPPSLVSFAA